MAATDVVCHLVLRDLLKYVIIWLKQIIQFNKHFFKPFAPFTFDLDSFCSFLASKIKTSVNLNRFAELWGVLAKAFSRDTRIRKNFNRNASVRRLFSVWMSSAVVYLLELQWTHSSSVYRTLMSWVALRGLTLSLISTSVVFLAPILTFQ